MKSSKFLSLFAGIIFISILIIPFKSFSQIIEEFPSDSAKFIDTYTEFMENKISETNESSFEKFKTFWTTGKFEENRRDSITVVANALLHSNGKREPHFIKMMQFFVKMDTVGFGNGNFQTWMKSFHHAISLPRRKLPNAMLLMDFTTNFFEYSALNLSNTRNWYASGEKYDFTFDTTLKIIYDQTDLKCRFREDSIQIFNTYGTYYPFTKSWNGKNGKVTWERAGYSKDNIYAELADYDINMNRAEFNADSVEFINKLYFDKPVLGRLEDQLVHIIKPANAIYPVFQSYQNLFEIENIYENMDFTGGFTMKGAQFIGSGERNQEAVIHVRNNDQLFMTIESKVFILQKSKAVSRNASVTIHLGRDSIYHTGLQFNYLVNSQEIEFTSNNNALSESVYYNSYHNVSMKFDRLLWRTTEDKIYFTYGKNKAIGNATFTSGNYFTLEKWNDIEMRDDVHPLIAIRNYTDKVNSRRFDVNQYAKFVRKPNHMVKNRLIPIAQDGFIFYDLDTDTVTVNDKLYDFISSRIEKIDYDVIRLQSTTQAPQHNGVLDLNSMDLKINGVPRIHLSDSQNVVIFPSHRQIVMHKNRHFNFGGVVRAGLFTFFGKDYDFNYDDFKISMERIDSLEMMFQTDQLNSYGQAVLARVENTINDLSGDIYIDKPNNKSGREYYPNFPKFESKQKSYVYYNQLFNGPYKRKNFYFELYPFQMDSLDNFNPENLKFKGNFYSAGIFPPFEETLELRDDNSMGFTKKTPQEGYPLYEGKGRFYKKIDMSNRGLKGEGEVDYLTSHMKTEDILFFPDSTSIHATNFEIKEKTTGIEYPEVHSKAVNIKWYPHEDVMNISRTDSLYTIFNDSTHFDGSLVLKPTGLTGSGALDMSKALLKSKYFTYDARKFDADTADFNLRTLDQQDMAFTANKLNAHVDLDYQRGRFETIENYTKGDFPKNLYVAYLDKFSWKMDKNSLDLQSYPQPKPTTYGIQDEMERLKDFDAQGVLYVSKHKSQDSLRFISSEAEYTLEDNTLHAKEVDSIYIADAKIVPKDGLINVGEQASIDTLRNAEVIANRESRYHDFFESKVKIKGRKDYKGAGNYTYTDKINTEQTIHFNEISVDNSIQTIAKGTIAHTDSFTLSPHFRYRGDVFVSSPRKYLEFKGGVRLRHSCPLIRPKYTYFESIINPDNVSIPIGEKLRDLNRRKVFVGSYVTLDSAHIYSTFLTPRKDPSDDLIISSKGWLRADDKRNKYIITSKEKFANPDTTGSLISLDKKYCIYHAEGKMSLGVDFGEMSINPAGELNHDLPENKVQVELTLPVDFLFSKAALDTMANDIRSRNDLRPINLESKYFRRNLNEIYDNKTVSKFLQQVKLFKSDAKIPSELSNTILFSDIDFKWNTSSNSYVAQDNIGIALINGKPVNKYVDGYVEIIKQKTGDRIYMYLKVDDNRFYFFYYFRGMLRTWSDNKTFITAIEDVPKRKRKISDGWFRPTKYRYILSTQNSFSRFMRRKREVEQQLERLENPPQQKDNQAPEEPKKQDEKKEIKNKKEKGTEQKSQDSL